MEGSGEGDQAVGAEVLEFDRVDGHEVDDVAGGASAAFGGGENEGFAVDIGDKAGADAHAGFVD